MIGLAAKHKLQLHQIDVATAFLNGELKEEIYMKQPQEFEVKEKDTWFVSWREACMVWGSHQDDGMKLRQAPEEIGFQTIQ